MLLEFNSRLKAERFCVKRSRFRGTKFHSTPFMSDWIDYGKKNVSDGGFSAALQVKTTVP